MCVRGETHAHARIFIYIEMCVCASEKKKNGDDSVFFPSSLRNDDVFHLEVFTSRFISCSMVYSRSSLMIDILRCEERTTTTND